MLMHLLPIHPLWERSENWQDASPTVYKSRRCTLKKNILFATQNYKKPSILSKTMFMKNSKQFILVCLIGTLFMAAQAMNQLNAHADHKMNMGNDIQLDLPIKYCKMYWRSLALTCMYVHSLSQRCQPTELRDILPHHQCPRNSSINANINSSS
ncbi:unnamed protein product [Adineta ricciae]|uniref:Uncharacterized protein n=1 Tax=Adineta ricciae TaxID=249248 RepID=A0A814VFU1_ADIRI|nr:unnamed protein product [Adineta ricciae]